MKSKLIRMMKATTLLTVAAAIALTATLSSCDAPVSQGSGTRSGQAGQAGRSARAALVEDLSGTVDAFSNDVEMAAFQGMALVREDILSTGIESWASLEMAPERFALVGESSEVMVTSLIDGTAENTVFYMNKGTLWVGVKDRLSPGETIIVQTPSVALSVRGTAFSVAMRDVVTEINVFSSEVEVRTQDMSGEPIYDEEGEQVDISLAAGQSAKITVSGGIVTGVEISERASVNAPQDVRDKLNALMPGTFLDSSGGEDAAADVPLPGDADDESGNASDTEDAPIVVSSDNPITVTGFVDFVMSVFPDKWNEYARTYERHDLIDWLTIRKDIVIVFDSPLYVTIDDEAVLLSGASLAYWHWGEEYFDDFEAFIENFERRRVSITGRFRYDEMYQQELNGPYRLSEVFNNPNQPGNLYVFSPFGGYLLEPDDIQFD